MVLDERDLGRITDPEARRIRELLLTLVGTQAARIATLKAVNQRLRDEVNRPKGEQGKPTILPNKRREPVDHSSEHERREPPQAWQKEAKLPHLQIDRAEERRLDRAHLPEDAQVPRLRALAGRLPQAVRAGGGGVGPASVLPGEHEPVQGAGVVRQHGPCHLEGMVPS